LGKLAHGLLLSDINPRMTKVGERTQQAVSGWQRQPVGDLSKLGKQIKDHAGQWPAKLQVDAHLCACRVGKKEAIRLRVVGRVTKPGKVIFPPVYGTPCAEFSGYETARVHILSWAVTILSIHRPNFSEAL
jgi:hypothetical protein